jgi:transposase
VSRKAFYNWVEKLSQGRLKVADNVRRGRPVDIVTGASVQRVEELIGTGMGIRIDSVATALGCPHGLVYRIMHDRLNFRKVCAR